MKVIKCKNIAGNLCVLAFVCSLMSGCATMVRGTTQSVSINSDPDGATVTLSNGNTCVTPCVMEAQRKNSLQITVDKEGCRRQTTAMVPTLAGAGAMLGGMIDYGTGAVYDLQPNPLFVTLTCDDLSSRRPLSDDPSRK